MTIREKLEAMRRCMAKNKAVDEAFVLGQKSVKPMREFSKEELQILIDVLKLEYYAMAPKTRESRYAHNVLSLLNKIHKEIMNR